MFWRQRGSQFNGFVPHDDVARQREGLHVDDVDVPPLRPHVQPLALEGQVAVRDPGEGIQCNPKVMKMCT